MEKGIEKGIEKGMEKGMEKGIEKGMLQGALAEKKRNAKAMKTLGLPAEDIAKVTGLSTAEINLL